MKNSQFEEYLSLLLGIWNLLIRPTARCEHCSKSLTVTEIVSGYRSDDAEDCTTACPTCGARLYAITLDSFGVRRCALWSAPYALRRLSGMAKWRLDQIAGHPSVYHSAIFHFGSLFHAFQCIGTEYRRERLDLNAKGYVCLGKISDDDIAKIFGVRYGLIGEMRKKLHIPRYPSRGSLIPRHTA